MNKKVISGGGISGLVRLARMPPGILQYKTRKKRKNKKRKTKKEKEKEKKNTTIKEKNIGKRDEIKALRTNEIY